MSDNVSRLLCYVMSNATIVTAQPQPQPQPQPQHNKKLGETR